MAAVVLSGVVGRFIHIQIPHSLSGQELNLNDLNALSLEYDNKLKKETSFNAVVFNEIEKASVTLDSNVSFTSGIIQIVNIHFKMKSILSSLKSKLKEAGFDKTHIKETLQTAKNKIVISRKIRLLRSMQRLFRYWHIFHLPFAIIMFVIMLIHVGVTILFGYKWIF
jgi:hypothetical protein